jgi:hypothetical protein
VYQARGRSKWLARLPDRGVRFRAEALYAELDVLRALRPKARAALIREARRDPAWKLLCSIPFVGPVRTTTHRVLPIIPVYSVTYHPGCTVPSREARI